jgi:hypothetical protein
MLILERLNEVKIPIVALQARPGTAELNHTYEDDFLRLMSVPLGLRLLACFAVLAVASPYYICSDQAMDERRKGYYIEGEGATYAALSLPQYISAFATRVLQCTSVCLKGERA